MHLAASFTMVTNHLHGPERPLEAVGACGRGGDGDSWDLDLLGRTGGSYGR